MSKILTTRMTLRHTTEMAKLIYYEDKPPPPVPDGIITEDDSPTPPGDILVHSEAADDQLVTE